MSNRKDSEPFGREKRLEVLLSEYSVRSSELAQSLTGLLVNINIFIAVLLALVALAIEPERRPLLGLLPTLLLLFFSIETHRHWTIRVQGVYIDLLEARINELAGERLLAWSSAAGNYVRWVCRFRLKEPRSGRDIMNLNPVMIVVPSLSLALLFFYGLASGGSFILSGLALPMPWRVVLLVIYGCFHLMVASFLLTNTLAQQERVLAVVRAEVANHVFHNSTQVSDTTSLSEEETRQLGQSGAVNKQNLQEDDRRGSSSCVGQD